MTATRDFLTVAAMNPLVLRALAHELDAACRGRTVRRVGLLNPQEFGLVLAGRPEPDMVVLAVWPGAPHARLEPSARFNRRLTDQLGEVPALLAGAVLTAVDTIGLERVLRLVLRPYSGETSQPGGTRQTGEASKTSQPGETRQTGEAGETSEAATPPLAIFFELLPRTPFLVVTLGEAVVAAVRAPGTSRPDNRRMERGAPYLLPFNLNSPKTVPPAAAVIEACLASASGADPRTWARILAPHLRGVPVERLAAILTGASDAAEAGSRLVGYRGPVVIAPDAEGAPELVPGVGDGPRTAGVLAVVAEWARLRMQHERASRLRTTLARALRTEAATLTRARQGLARDTRKLGDAASLRRQGEIVLAHLPRITRGTARVELPDPYGGDPVAIDLDPRRTPAANAQAYFQAARRAERAAQKLAARARELDERGQALAAAETRLAEIGDSSLDAMAGARDMAGLARDLAGLARDLAATGVLPGELVKEIVEATQGEGGAPKSRATRSGTPKGGKRTKRGEPPVRLPYRAYPLSGGWEVWVGRSSADNDVLTHELARPHDLWLHARGAAGSHVVLRRSDGSRGIPPRAVIEAAASYAAFFSQARHSRLVPVIVTEKRYVRKPRRSPPGMAACLREKTVMAAPRRPAGGEGMEQD